MENRTFKLEDLDEAFWQKVIFINIWNLSGMGGTGSLWIITSDKKLFFIGYESLPCSEFNLDEFTPLLKKKETYENGRRTYVVEDEGWHFIPRENTLVRDDFYDDFMNIYNDRELRSTLGWWVQEHMPAIAGLALGLEGEPERYNDEKSYQLWNEYMKEKAEFEWKRKELALTPEDFVWKELHTNNNPANEFLLGEYAMIFKDCDKKTIGYRFTILYQREEISPLHYAGTNSNIERYNLFELKYDNVMGPLTYEESKYDVMYRQSFDQSTNTLYDCDLNTPGQFIRSFATVEEARLYALEVANIRHYTDKETIIKDLDNEDRIYRNWLRKYEALLTFHRYYEDILRIVCDYEYSDNSSFGGGYIVDAIQKELDLDMDVLGEIWNYIPLVLSKGTQEKAKAIVHDSKEYFKHRKNGDTA